MTWRWYMAVIGACTLISWLAWVIIVWSVNPEGTNWLGFILFYGSLAAGIGGVSGLLGLVIRQLLWPRELVIRMVADSFRQAVWVSLTVVASLMLMHYDLFSWWNAILLIIFFILCEYMTGGHAKQRQQRPRRHHIAH